jgi:putative addiction module component (TIGR02574 family)
MATDEPKSPQCPPMPQRRLVEDFGDDANASPDITPALSAEQLEEIERRLDEHMRDPGAATPWEEVRARLWSKLQ